MRPLADGLFALPAGIEWADLAWIAERVAIIAAVFAIIGILLLRRLAGRSIGFMVAITVAGVLAHLDGRDRRHRHPDGGHPVRTQRHARSDGRRRPGRARRGGVRRAAAHQGQPGAVLGGAGRRRYRRLRGAQADPAGRAQRPVRRAHRHARAPGPGPVQGAGARGQPARARRLGQPRPAHPAGRPAGHGRGAGRPGGGRPARGEPVPLADPPRGGPAHRDDRRPVRAVPHPRGRAAADQADGRPGGPGRRGRGQHRSGGAGQGRSAYRGRGARHAGLRRRGRDGPGPAQPGHQRDPAHPARRRAWRCWPRCRAGWPA